MAEKTEGLNPRTQRVRDALMAAALDLVSERPVSEISLTEIAEKAQVSRPTVYKQFTDTPSLVAATAEALMERVFADIDTQVAPLQGEAYLHELMRLFIGSVYRKRTFCKHAMFGPSSSEITFYVSDMLDARMRRGYIGQRLATSPVSNECCAAISAGVIWLLVKWLDSDFSGENAPDDVAARMTDVMLQLSSTSQ